MGQGHSQLAAVAASSLQDFHLHDLENTVLQTSIGDSRLLKTLKCLRKERNVVVKVFIKRDAALSLSRYQARLDEINHLLTPSEHPNVLPYEVTKETDKAAYLIRPYIYLDLYDRISTRPFLTELEKRWIVFQMLCAADQMHSAGVTHGDIKTQNILVTSSSWTFLTDFANYKPTYLPEDNPADFSYFFDISGRRACYLAPERFYHTGKQPPSSGSDAPTPEMDLFSLGCVIAELFSDGRPLFDYSGLLAYRHKSVSLADLGINPSRIADASVRDLIGALTDLDPAKRGSAKAHLEAARGGLFPEYFYTCLHPFLSRMLHENADTKVSMIVNRFSDLLEGLDCTSESASGEGLVVDSPSHLKDTLGEPVSALEAAWNSRHADIASDAIEAKRQRAASATPIDHPDQIRENTRLLVEALDSQNGSQGSPAAPQSGAGESDGDPTNPHLVTFDSLPVPGLDPPPPQSDDAMKVLQSLTRANSTDKGAGLALVLSEVCSCLGGCVRSLSRMQCLSIMLDAAPYVSDEVLFQRLVPYAISILGDPNNNVRALAITAVATLLRQVNSFPPADAHVFHEYIFPSLARFTQDPVENVRITYARNLVILAETSRRFLDIAQLLRENDLGVQGPGEQDETRVPQTVPYDKELDNIQDAVVRTVMEFLTDQSTAVRRAILGELTRLSMFLGRQKTNDIILPLVITFLNSRDWELRRAFFHNVVGVSSYLGRRSLEDFVLPCILQAIYDEEEFVIEKALMALARLTEAGLFTKHVLLDILKTVAPLLCHPCTWIRYGATAFIVASAAQLTLADTHCLLVPLIKPFLRREVIELTTRSLLEALRSPVRQYAFDRALRMPTHFHEPEPPEPAPAPVVKGSPAGKKGKGSASPKKGKKGSNNSSPSVTPAAKPVEKLQQQRKRRQSFRHAIDKTEQESGLPSMTMPQILEDETGRPRTTSAELPFQEDDNDSFPLRLYIDNLSAEDEEKLRHMRGYIIASAKAMQEKSKVWESENSQRMQQTSELEQLSQLSKVVTVHSMPIRDKTEFFFPPSSASTPPPPGKILEDEYNSFFGMASDGLANLPADLEDGQTAAGQSSGTGATTHGPGSTGTGHTMGANMDTVTPTVSSGSHPVGPSKAIPPPPPDLGTLRKEPAPDRPTRNRQSAVPTEPEKAEAWRPRGVLVAHLHEHRAAVNTVCVSADNLFIASGSDDGTVKIWDGQRIEKDVTNRSRLTYSSQSGKISAISICENTHSVASASSEGTIHVFRVDYTSKKDGSVDKYSGLSLVKEVSSDEGAIIAVDHYNTQQQSLVVYATRAGLVHGWDLRARREAYCLRNQPNLGLLQTMTTDPAHMWLVGGTSRGYMTCWDLRFQIPVKTWQHPSKSRIHDMVYVPPTLLPSPTRGVDPTAAAQEGSASILVASGKQEASIWDIAKSSCRQRFVVGGRESGDFSNPSASQEIPPLTALPENLDYNDIGAQSHSIRTLLTPTGTRAVLTGGTDGSVRYWDLAQAQRSYTVCGSVSDPPPTYSLHYPDPMNPSYCVFQESSSAVGASIDDSGTAASRTTVDATTSSSSAVHVSSATSASATDSSSTHHTFDPNPVAHRDAIYDLATIKLSQRLLISCSRDGVIKVWK